jgi:hypothetical protein
MDKSRVASDVMSKFMLHVKITQLDKCRMFLSIVVSVASSLQLSQVSQVGHKCRK